MLGHSLQYKSEIDELLLHDPAEYERLLQSYWLLLGQRKLWWERVSQAEHPGWKSCVRGAIMVLANRCGVPAKVVASWLDLPEFSKSRALVLELARERLASAR